MGTYDRGRQLMQVLKDHDVRAVADPRSAHPPCVLIPPPTRTYDLPWPAYSVTWSLVCLAPGPGSADAWVKLDQLADTVLEALEPSDTTVTPASYQLPGPSEPTPAYIITWTEGTDL